MIFEWEQISHVNGDSCTERAKVLGGWLVKVIQFGLVNDSAMSVTFIPDKDHKWKVDK